MTYPEPDCKDTAILSIALSICFVITGINMIKVLLNETRIDKLESGIETIKVIEDDTEFE